MSDCIYCQKNGKRVDGEEFGVCRECRRKKCHQCGNASAGKTLCTNCDFSEQLDRMRGRVMQPWLFEDDARYELWFRQELTWESKRMLHEAVEMFSRGAQLIIVALHSGLEQKKEVHKTEAA